LINNIRGEIRMPHYFDSLEPQYRVIDEAMYNISEKKKGFYESIFTDEYDRLEEDNKQLVLGVICGEYGISMDELIQYCVEEQYEEEKSPYYDGIEEIKALNKRLDKLIIEQRKMFDELKDTEVSSDGTQRVELTGMTHCCDGELERIKDELIADSKRLDRLRGN
jgi:restriction endonuclease S subunit